MTGFNLLGGPEAKHICWASIKRTPLMENTFTSTLLEYVHFLLLYASTPLHLREKTVLFTPLHLF